MLSDEHIRSNGSELHFLCALWLSSELSPADEEGCLYDGPGGLEHTTLSPGDGGGGSSGSGVGAHPVTIAVTVVIAAFWMVIIGVCMGIRYMRGCKCLRARSRSGQDCPDQPRDAIENTFTEVSQKLTCVHVP